MLPHARGTRPRAVLFSRTHAHQSHAHVSHPDVCVCFCPSIYLSIWRPWIETFPEPLPSSSCGRALLAPTWLLPSCAHSGGAGLEVLIGDQNDPSNMGFPWPAVRTLRKLYKGAAEQKSGVFLVGSIKAFEDYIERALAKRGTEAALNLAQFVTEAGDAQEAAEAGLYLAATVAQELVVGAAAEAAGVATAAAVAEAEAGAAAAVATAAAAAAAAAAAPAPFTFTAAAAPAAFTFTAAASSSSAADETMVPPQPPSEPPSPPPDASGAMPAAEPNAAMSEMSPELSVAAGSKRSRDDPGAAEQSHRQRLEPPAEPIAEETEPLRHVRIAVDAGDIAKELFIDPRTYAWDGDVDASAIGDYDPRELQKVFAALARGLDAVSNCESTGKGAIELICNVLVHLIEQLPQLKNDLVNAASLHEIKMVLFAKRNVSAAATKAAKAADGGSGGSGGSGGGGGSGGSGGSGAAEATTEAGKISREKGSGAMVAAVVRA